MSIIGGSTVYLCVLEGVSSGVWSLVGSEQLLSHKLMSTASIESELIPLCLESRKLHLSLHPSPLLHSEAATSEGGRESTDSQGTAVSKSINSEVCVHFRGSQRNKITEAQ